jgi:glutathione peroxidase
MRYGMRFGLISLLVLCIAALSPAQATTAYDFSFPAIDGSELKLSDYQGKVLVVVNTASQCGFTGQYDDLQQIWQRYQNQGLVVIGVPSNDFGGQEPGSNSDIKDFCETNFSIDFPMSEKVVVIGDGAHPFYRWAKNELGAAARPRWNFHKYIIGRDGQLADWFSSMTNPSSKKFRGAVEAALGR